jgi:phosphatidate cytidylyltransferase
MMKQRMITVVVGISLLLLILVFYKTVILNVAIALITVVMVYEIFSATKNMHNVGLMAICGVFAAAAPFLNYLSFEKSALLATFGFLTALFILLLSKHETLRLEQVAICFMLTFLTSISVSCIAYLRDFYLDTLKDGALFYIVLVFVGAWMTDAGGYIFGSIFGKHKLSPSISPKKSVEGAIGGIVLTVLAFAGLALGYKFYLQSNGINAQFNYFSIITLSVLCAILSILGDLGASIVKRQNNIKDFGNVLPGHGGVLDRFDSILFVAPLILIYLQFFHIVSVL